MLSDQLEFARLHQWLTQLPSKQFVEVELSKPSPLAFPLFVDRLRGGCPQNPGGSSPKNGLELAYFYPEQAIHHSPSWLNVTLTHHSLLVRLAMGQGTVKGFLKSKTSGEAVMFASVTRRGPRLA